MARLNSAKLLRELLPGEVDTADHAHRVRMVPSGGIIYRQADPADGLYVLKKGRVRLSRFSPSGKRLDAVVVRTGSLFGETPLFGERKRQAEAEAIDDCTLYVLSEAEIVQVLMNKPRLAIRLLETIGRRLTDAEARLEDLAHRTMPARLAAVLLRLSDERGEVIEDVTHQQLAHVVGAYRETVTKILHEFQARGCVELARRRIRIVDRPALAVALDDS